MDRSKPVIKKRSEWIKMSRQSGCESCTNYVNVNCQLLQLSITKSVYPFLTQLYQKVKLVTVIINNIN